MNARFLDPKAGRLVCDTNNAALARRAGPDSDGGCETRDGTRVILPVVRRTGADPELGIAFDLETLAWSEPFPHPHPEGTASDWDDG